ncbi:probable E3 ubiquitin-protein ligase RNF144A-A [Amphiprion ocellaris]|uniref:RING-type domain-containing protein n=1 Tax=Amphiprion ocellaris TaxID=80972 RepID=A0A3Q1CXE0_AMPOC|nr:probable E3 ubiquitin-protein ligase RNF144A-A [Amphiprion ocellaris]
MGSKLSKRKRISKKSKKTVTNDSPYLSSTFPPVEEEEEEEGEEKCYDPADSSLIFVDEEDVLDFEINEFKSLRALMSCGHAVTPMSLTNWCRLLVDQGESTFVCGQTGCDVEWSFEEVCKMALLTDEEVKYFENKMFSNSKDLLDVKSCPSCESSVMRNDPYNLCVECTVCSADKNGIFMFCWQCLREWRGPFQRSDRCENYGCVNKSLEILKNCPVITFNDVAGITDCPSIRACPTCGFIVEHDRSGCKNIFCTRCKEEFCFVCLQLTDDCLETSEHFEPCSSGVAPRQTFIPVWQ